MYIPKDCNRYFIAIIPPPPVYEQTEELKNYFFTHYQSKAALNSPPHITLHMPFLWKEKKEDELIEKLKQFTVGQKTFDLQLKNFNCFVPRVIFLSVTNSLPLKELQKQLHQFCKSKLNLFNAQYKELPFHPHLTVAFRDLKKHHFEKAWLEFENKNVEANFRVTSIVLLKSRNATVRCG